jgi:hypothetical protein
VARKPTSVAAVHLARGVTCLAAVLLTELLKPAGAAVDANGPISQ